MTKFLHGPAAGQTLMLHRAVKFLRVTEENGKFDALDQPSDTPKPTEKLYAYTIVGEPGMVHLNRGGGKGGFYTRADYRLIEPQPGDAVMRNRQQWYDWCQQQ